VSDIFLRPFLCWSEEKATFGLRFLQSQARDTQMVIFHRWDLEVPINACGC
jgi:hypothetical protein